MPCFSRSWKKDIESCKGCQLRIRRWGKFLGFPCSIWSTCSILSAKNWALRTIRSLDSWMFYVFIRFCFILFLPLVFLFTSTSSIWSSFCLRWTFPSSLFVFCSFVLFCSVLWYLSFLSCFCCMCSTWYRIKSEAMISNQKNTPCFEREILLEPFNCFLSFLFFSFFLFYLQEGTKITKSVIIFLFFSFVCFLFLGY